MMKFKHTAIFALTAILATQPLLAKPSSEDRAAFKEHYQHYQVLAEEKKWTEALPHAKNAYELGLAMFGPESKNTAALSYNYGLNLVELSEREQASEVFQTTLSHYEKVYGKKSIELVPVLVDLGDSLGIPFKANREKRYYDRALKIAESHHGKDSIIYGELLMDVGNGLMRYAQSSEAKYYLYQSYEVFEKTLGQNNTKTGYAAFQVGKYALATRRYSDAKNYLLKALASFEDPNKPSNVFELSTHGFLVEAYEGLKQREMATKHCLAIGKMTPFTTVQEYQPLVKVPPKYPRSANKAGLEGFVTVEFDVDKSGLVINPTVIDSNGHASLERASLKAAEGFRYAPSFKDGKPVVTEGVQNRFTFELVR
jgi:TonB family protein